MPLGRFVKGGDQLIKQAHDRLCGKRSRRLSMTIRLGRTAKSSSTLTQALAQANGGTVVPLLVKRHSSGSFRLEFFQTNPIQ
jgi:hypothetical protein